MSSACRDLDVDHTNQQYRSGLEHSCICRDCRLVPTADGRRGSPIPVLAPPSRKSADPRSYHVWPVEQHKLPIVRIGAKMLRFEIFRGRIRFPRVV